MVRKPFQMPLFVGIEDLSELFEKAGHQLYVVGGAVRDRVMGSTPKDYDLATDAEPDRVIEILSRSGGWSTDLTGKSFGVVRARGSREGDLHEYEIATFRRDVGEGRRPDAVEFTSIEEDVKRRDLTINALFYDIQRQEIVDLVGGLQDIWDGVIRTVGRPEDRFREDPLRVLRALRFAGRTGWKIDHDTSEAIKAQPLDGVSPERIRDEFVRGLASAKKIDSFIRLLSEHDMWPRLFRDLDVDTRYCDGTLRITQYVPIILALLLDRNAPSRVKDVLREMKYTSEEIDRAVFLLDFKRLVPADAYRMRRRFKLLGIDDFTLIEYQVSRCMPEAKGLLAFLAYQLTVDGDDLLAEGYSGQALGKELERRETELFMRLL